MKPGEIVIFRKRREPCCGVFLSEEYGVLKIFSEEGREVSVPGKKVARFTGIAVYAISEHERKMEMRRLRRELEESKKDFDLKALWEQFAGVGEVVSFDDILSAYYAEREPVPATTLKLFWAVDKDTVYFKRHGDGYLPLPAKCVEKTLSQLEKRVEALRQQKLSVEWIKSVLCDEPLEPEGFDRDGCVKAVIAYIGSAEDSPAFVSARKILSEAGIRDPFGAVEFLVKTGDLPEGSDPVMIQTGINESFPVEALEESARLLSDDSLPDSLEDMTGLETISIDEETTEDIDDAISVELSRGEAHVGIHIANVALHIPPDGHLDRAALRAAETMYLPERRVDIFPNDLIKEKLSLIEGVSRVTLSLLATFDTETFKMKNFRFAASKIAVNSNMSYDGAERLFQSSPEWETLAIICKFLKQKRIERGAFIVQVPELKIKADLRGNVEVAQSNTDMVSHEVVSELMIMTNHLSAVFLRDREVPTIFRLQTQPVLREAREIDPADPLFPLRVLRLLGPSAPGVLAGWHRSLGVDCYAQATSPIRRYRDLVVQRQIMSELGFGAALDENSISSVITDTEPNIHLRRVAQRSRKRFWLCEYFRRMGKNQKLKAVVSRVTDRRVFVWLTDYFSEFPLHGADTGLLNEGENITVIVKSVDPLKRKLKLRPA